MKEKMVSLEMVVDLLYRLNVDPHKVQLVADLIAAYDLHEVARELRWLYEQNGFYASYR